MTDQEFDSKASLLLLEIKRLHNAVLAIENRHSKKNHDLSQKIHALELKAALLQNEVESLKESRTEFKNQKWWFVTFAVGLWGENLLDWFQHLKP